MVNRFCTTSTGHARGYREYQPELAVRCLLYAVDARPRWYGTAVECLETKSRG